ncbi:MAG TPA: hypothetical protein VLL49_12400 [Anaerolineales bacterium]|nr:hypothetical protein [Anaerolineales bacterium]
MARVRSLPSTVMPTNTHTPSMILPATRSLPRLRRMSSMGRPATMHTPATTCLSVQAVLCRQRSLTPVTMIIGRMQITAAMKTCSGAGFGSAWR